MATTIKLKNSVTTTNAPSSLAQGEVAINITDKKVWVGNAATTPIQLLGDGGSVTFTSLTVTGVSTFSAGTVSAPSITTSGDTNTGIFFPAADTIAFAEGGVESGRFTSTGALQLTNNLTFTGTGNRITGDFSNATASNRVLFQSSTTNGNTLLGVIPNGTATQSNFILYNSSDALNTTSLNLLVNSSEGRINIGQAGTGTYLPMTFYTGGSERLRIDTSGNTYIGDDKRCGFGGTNNAISGNTAGNILYFITNNTERMRITSGGAVLIGKTSATIGSAGQLEIDSSYPQQVLRDPAATAGRNWRVGMGSGSEYIIYANGTTGQYMTWNATSWTASSDERQKDIIEPITNAVDKVATLRTVIGKYKSDDEDTRRAFLIAQDVQKVFPEAVDVRDDEEKTLGLRYTEMIPLLVASIKELNAKVEAQAAEIALLKSK